MQLRYSSPVERLNNLVWIVIGAIRRKHYGKALNILKNNHKCINSIIVYDEPLLSWTLRNNYDPIVAYLLEIDEIDVNLTDADGMNALHVACDYNFQWVVKLIEKGGNINKLSTSSQTSPVQFLINSIVCSSFNNRISKMILLKYIVEQTNVNLNAYTKHRDLTVLMMACQMSNVEIVQCLLFNNHIDLELTNDFGMTALHVAVIPKCPGILSLNDEYKNTTTNTLDIVSSLLCRGSLVNATDRAFKTPLHYAVQLPGPRHYDVVNTLIANGAFINAQELSGVSILHTAVKNNDVPLIDLLITNGADIHCVDTDNESALHYAVRYSNFEVVVALVEHHNADIHLMNKHKQTAKDLVETCVPHISDIYDYLSAELEKQLLHGFKRAKTTEDYDSENDSTDAIM
jgi:ankyrin repeat protein